MAEKRTLGASLLDEDFESESSDADYEPPPSSSEESSGSGDETESDSSDGDIDISQIRQWTKIATVAGTVPLAPPPPRFPFVGNPGIVIDVLDSNDPLQLFELFIDNFIIEHIVIETNKFALQEKAKHIPIKPNSRSKYWTPTSANELRIFFAVLMLQGIVQKPNEQWYWSKKKLLLTPSFSSLISECRYFLLMKYLHFDDNETYDENTHPQPKLRKIWTVFEYLTSKFSIYLPQRDICIDESLMLFKGHLSWIQYIPLKCARFGVKFFMLCESQSGYVWSVIIYTGKDTNIGDQHQDYCMGTKVIMKLMEPLSNMGYCLTSDNYYNSPELAELLLEKKTDFYGTLRINRRDIPKEIQDVKLKKGECVAYQKGKTMIMRWRDKKYVNLISSLHNPEMLEVTKRNNIVVKPKLVMDYNNTMGGVDRVDQQLSCYPVTRKRQKKYYKKVFRHLLDIAILNSFILYKKSGGKKTHLEYRLSLVDRIVEMYHGQLVT